MKRSEFWKSCFETLGGGSHGTTGANYLAYKADSAGTPWEPEEPPKPLPKLPERICAVREGICKGMLGVEVAGSTRLLTMAEALEVERRFNAWQELREIIEGEPCVAPINYARKVQARLLAILDGKEGS